MKSLDYELLKEEASTTGIKLFKEANDKAYKTLLRGHLMLYHNVFPSSELTTQELEKVYSMVNNKELVVN